MSDLKPSWPFVPSAERYVESALGMLGIDRERGTGYFWHELIGLFAGVLVIATRPFAQGKLG